MTDRLPFLSKSRFIKGLQCHKALWLTTHRPELLPPTTDKQRLNLEPGLQVGRWAHSLFPGGVEVQVEGSSRSGQAEETETLLQKNSTTIFEAAFTHGNVFVRADILHKRQVGWLLAEVKAASDFKETYLHDLAVQYSVISACGLDVTKAMLLLIDTKYVRQGEIEPEKLFKFADLTEAVLELQDPVAEELEIQKEVLADQEPSLDIGPYCLNPDECDFKCHCWARIPEGSVFEFAGPGKPDSFALYQQGYVLMEDVPKKLLKPRQRQQAELLHTPDPHVDKKALKEFLDGLVWPLSFLDFETTFMTPMPLWEATSPFQPVPFQFSLHVQGGLGGELHHHEFLAESSNDPRPEFIKALLGALPPSGSVLVWNKGFESGVLKKLSEVFPGASEALLEVKERLVDLMSPFQGRKLYHGKMNGSYSIKKVLPALCPECSYEGLEIQSGDVAASSWMEMVTTEDQDRREQLKLPLLNYCELDTLAMVKILMQVSEMS